MEHPLSSDVGKQTLLGLAWTIGKQLAAEKNDDPLTLGLISKPSNSFEDIAVQLKKRKNDLTRELDLQTKQLKSLLAEMKVNEAELAKVTNILSTL